MLEDIDLTKELENVKKFDLSGYKRIKKIGSGSYGNAFLYMKDTHKIVVKEFIGDLDFDTLDLIKREIINQSECHKENLIVPFLGISYVDSDNKPQQFPLLIMEYEETGSLKNFDKSSINDTQKMIIIYGVAKGLQFLHHVPICHRDLNPNNIVLDSNQNPLICDFGASRQISLVHINEGTHRGTPIYMSPEMLKIEDITTEVLLPSDIFSFGVVVYNLLTNKIPYSDELKNIQTFIALGKFLNSGKRIKLPESIPSWFRYLIQLCWKQNPADRPTIDDIVNLFDVGIALPEIFDDERKSAKYFKYINEHLHLNIEKMNEDTLLSWYNRLLRDNKKELALVIDFMLADYFKNPKSQSNLGYLYFNGNLVDKNIKKAVDYFRKASDKNDPKSLFYLSEIYKLGLPEYQINVDLSESNRFLNLSASLHYSPAVELQKKSREFAEISKDNVPTIVVFGDKNVGKTSFINKILNRNINDPLLFPTTNIRDYYIPLVLENGKKTFLCIKDTPDFNSIQSNIDSIFNNNLKLVILIFDKTNIKSFDNIDSFVNRIKSQNRSKIMIVGNKMDSGVCEISYSNLKEKAKRLNADYFYEISSLKSSNIEMIFDEIVSFLNESHKNSSQDQINIKHFNAGKPTIQTIIVGSSGCGKTSFIHYLETKELYDDNSTPGAIVSQINLDLFTLNIWDTAGQVRFRSILGALFRTQNLFIIMFDLTDLGSFDEIDYFYHLIDDNSHTSIFKVLIFGNKLDKNDDRKVSYDAAAAKARSLNADYLEISCKNGSNFDMALRLIEEGNKYLSQNAEDNEKSGIVDINLKDSDQKKKCC